MLGQLQAVTTMTRAARGGQQKATTHCGIVLRPWPNVKAPEPRTRCWLGAMPNLLVVRLESFARGTCETHLPSCLGCLGRLLGGSDEH